MNSILEKAIEELIDDAKKKGGEFAGFVEKQAPAYFRDLVRYRILFNAFQAVYNTILVYVLWRVALWVWTFRPDGAGEDYWPLYLLEIAIGITALVSLNRVVDGIQDICKGLFCPRVIIMSKLEQIVRPPPKEES